MSNTPRRRGAARLARTLLPLLVAPFVMAQGTDHCRPYLQFQVQTRLAAPRTITAPAIRGSLGGQPLSLISFTPFDLSSDTRNTLSLLIVIWNGSLSAANVQRFAASLRHEERLHLRISVLTRSGVPTAWTDDPAEQLRLLTDASAAASATRNDEPGVHPVTSDEGVMQSRWKSTIRNAIENLMQQPGKQVVLELLAHPPLRPPSDEAHWRIPADRDYTGESQVHASASLGLVPVFRVHNDRRTLRVIVPNGEASYSPPLEGGNRSEVGIGQEELQALQAWNMPSSLPIPSRLFQDLGGDDVYEATDAMPVILESLKRTYTVVVRMPVPCVPASLFPLVLEAPPHGTRSATFWIAPRWLWQRISGKLASDKQ